MGHSDGLLLLFSFYWRNFWRFQRELPSWLKNPVSFLSSRALSIALAWSPLSRTGPAVAVWVLGRVQCAARRASRILCFEGRGPRYARSRCNAACCGLGLRPGLRLQFRLELSSKTATEFNADYDRLKAQIRECSGTEREFKTSMVRCRSSDARTSPLRSAGPVRLRRSALLPCGS